jgi:hypothetical protein
MNEDKQILKLEFVQAPFTETGYYTVRFAFRESNTEVITDRHIVMIELPVEGNVPLGEVEKIGRERAVKFLKALVENL